MLKSTSDNGLEPKANQSKHACNALGITGCKVYMKMFIFMTSPEFKFFRTDTKQVKNYFFLQKNSSGVIANIPVEKVGSVGDKNTKA